MPQPVRFRAPGSRPGARVAGLRAFVGFVVGAALGCALVAPACAQLVTSGQIYIAGPGDRAGSDAATMTAMMDAHRAAPAAVAAPSQPAVRAGMISIPGPGEKNASGGGGASAPNVITIPGPGERVAGNSGNGAPAPQVITIPGPGERVASNIGNGKPATQVVKIAGAAQTANIAPPARVAPPRAPAATMQRVSFAPAASRVAQVVVGVPPAAASGVPNAAHNRPAAAPAAATQTAVAPPTPAQPPARSGQQDGESVRAAALAYLQQQSAGLPGRVNITVSPVFPRGLAACTSLEPFMPPGARTWGRTTVGVRCVGERPWTLYVQARVAVQVTYYTAARPIGPGDTLTATDLQPRDGDLASLPQTVITDPSQALGAVSLERIAAGLPLRTDMLRSASSVVIGQTVRLVAAGPNFTISTEGSALNNAAPGQRVQVRARNGQIISGIVKDAGTVQVQI